jgi:sulfoacetaldehyde dehydrogenase
MSDTGHPHGDGPENRAAAAVVDDCVTAAREAMGAVSNYDQTDTDQLTRAVAWAVYRSDHTESLIETTMAATGMGDPADKREKLRDRTKGILLDTLGEPSVGEIPCDREGVVELAKPVGVVGGLVPSTNPAATGVNLAILALKGRNALVLSASPDGYPTAAEAVEYMREQLAEMGAPRNLVQILPGEPSKEKARALLNQADLAQVTGSAANVQAGQESGTPNYCVSEGNPVAVVDESVDLQRVAESIPGSATYDGGTACIAESCAVVHETVFDSFRQYLTDANAYWCDEEDTARLRERLFPEGTTHPDRALVGRPATQIAEAAGVSVPADTSLLVVEPADVVDDPLVTECLAPLLAVVPVSDFDEGLAVTTEILDREGAGHSVAVHTDDREKAVAAGRDLDVCRMVVNQPNLASSGTVTNGLTHSLSMGGGTWAGNQLAENLSYRQFIQTTRVAFRTDAEEPSDAAVFGSFVEDDPGGAAGRHNS